MSADGVALVAADPLLESAQRLICEWSATEWCAADANLTSEGDQFILGRMVEIGVMRRRDTVVVICPGQHGQVRAVVTSIGDVSDEDRKDKLAEAAIEVMPRSWYHRSGEHRKAEFDWQPPEYRLTSEGELAQADVLGGRERLYLAQLMAAPDGQPHKVSGKVSIAERWYSESNNRHGGGWFATILAKIGSIHIGNNYFLSTAAGSGADDTPPPEQPTAEGSGSPRSSSVNVNDRMRADLDNDHTLVSLSAQRWADRLNCSKGAVVRTEMWKTIQAQREAMRNRADLSGTVAPEDHVD